MAHSRRQAVTSRRSTCGASTQAARMQIGTVGQFQHAWKSVAAVLAHGASRPARCPFPRSRPSHSPRSTYAARSQPSGGVLTPDKVSSTLRDEDSMASAVSESDADMRRSDANPRLLVVRFGPAPYAPRLAHAQVTGQAWSIGLHVFLVLPSCRRQQPPGRACPCRAGPCPMPECCTRQG